MHHSASPNMAAMNIAANFHRDAQACASKHERQQLYEQYRDKILAIDKLGANIAAAFLPFFGATGSREGPDAERWSDFDRLAQRGKSMRDRESQHIRHQSGVIAAWGGERFQYYGWEALPLPLLRQLHELAVLVPHWDDVVDLLNSKMLARHELRMLRGNNKALLIGEHSAASKVQNCRSPVERSDIISALDSARHKPSPVDLRQQMKSAAEKVKETRLKDFGLKRDLYSMLVPSTNSDSSDVNASSSYLTDPNVSTRSAKRTKLVTISPRPPRLLSTSSLTPRTNARDKGDALPSTNSNNDDASQGNRALNLRLQIESPTRMGSVLREHADSQSSPPEAMEMVEMLEEDAYGQSVQDINSRPEMAQESNSTIHVRDGNHNGGNEGASDAGADVEINDEATGDTDDQGEGRWAEAVSENGSEEMRNAESEACVAMQRIAARAQDSDAVEMEAIGVLSRMDRENHSGQVERQGDIALANPELTLRGDTGSSSHSPTLSIRHLDDYAPRAALGANSGGSLSSHINEPQSLDSPTLIQVDPSVANDSESLSGGLPSLLQTLQGRYNSEINRLIQDLRQPHASRDVAQQRLLQLEWLGSQCWADVYVESQRPLGRSSVASLEDADVWYLDWMTFCHYGDSDYVFERPVVIKQTFQDSGMYDIAEYIDMLWQRFPEQQILIQNSMTGARTSMSVKDYCLMVAEVDLSSSEGAAPVSNAINLGRLAQADEPLLTRLPRFGLLSMLADRVAGVIGRSSHLMLNEVKGCLGFDMLGFSGAFSGSRLDPLVGSWVRCLAGFSIWAIATDLDAEDWQRFSKDGREWSPQGKSRLIVLEQDDVLFLPPGLRAVHANFVPRRCLSEGGMLWDECRIPEIMEGLLYVAQNQSCIDTPLGIELAALIDSLETWLDDENYIYPSSNSGNTNKYHQAVKASIQSLRALL